MITAEDIEAFAAASAEPLAVAERVVKRAESATIRHRVFHAGEELPVLRALRAYRQIVDWQTQVIEGYQQDAIHRFENAVGCFDKAGNRTS